MYLWIFLILFCTQSTPLTVYIPSTELYRSQFICYILLLACLRLRHSCSHLSYSLGDCFTWPSMVDRLLNFNTIKSFLTETTCPLIDSSSSRHSSLYTFCKSWCISGIYFPSLTQNIVLFIQNVIRQFVKIALTLHYITTSDVIISF